MSHQRVMVGATRVPREMGGMPVFYGEKEIPLIVTPDDIKCGVEDDCDNCAIALAGKRQLGSPLARIGKAFAYLALPDKSGVILDGFGRTKFAVFAYRTQNMVAQSLIRSNDKGRRGQEGVMVTLAPRRKSERSEAAAARSHSNLETRRRRSKPKRRPVREEGVRNYAGRVWI